MDIQVFPLEISFNFNGIENSIYPIIIKTDSDLLLVDCGYAGFLPRIRTAATEFGISLEDLTGIIITHHDVDHLGGLHEFKEELPIYSSEIEEKYIFRCKKIIAFAAGRGTI